MVSEPKLILEESGDLRYRHKTCPTMRTTLGATSVGLFVGNPAMGV